MAEKMQIFLHWQYAFHFEGVDIDLRFPEMHTVRCFHTVDFGDSTRGAQPQAKGQEERK